MPISSLVCIIKIFPALRDNFLGGVRILAQREGCYSSREEKVKSIKCFEDPQIAGLHLTVYSDKN